MLKPISVTEKILHVVYYRGNTADLEIGQEVEDAELEEKGAKE